MGADILNTQQLHPCSQPSPPPPLRGDNASCQALRHSPHPAVPCAGAGRWSHMCQGCSRSRRQLSSPDRPPSFWADFAPAERSPVGRESRRVFGKGGPLSLLPQQSVHSLCPQTSGGVALGEGSSPALDGPLPRPRSFPSCAGSCSPGGLTRGLPILPKPYLLDRRLPLHHAEALAPRQRLRGHRVLLASSRACRELRV